MRDVDKSLDRPLKPPSAYFVQQESQDDRSREGENDIIKGNNERIGKKLAEFRVGKEVGEIPEPDPGTFEKAQIRIEILEGYQDAPHRQIFENGKVKHSRDQQNVKPYILSDQFQFGCFCRYPDRFGWSSIPTLQADGSVAQNETSFDIPI